MKRTVTTLSLSAALSLASFAACNATGGIPITLTLAFEGIGDGRFTTASGWEVELTEARAIVGPVYAYAPLDEDDVDDEMAWRAPLGGPSVARAHGDLDPLDGRVVRAEHLEQRAVDALASVIDVGEVAGLEGRIESLTIGLDAPAGALAASDGPTRGHHLFVRGTARREGEEVSFEGGLDLGENELDRRVDGVPVAGALTSGARLVVGIDADAWLAEADFAALVDGRIAPATQPERAFRLGARSAASFSGRIEQGGER